MSILFSYMSKFFLGIPSFLLRFSCHQIVAMRDVSATETAIIYGLEPVWGATFAWAIHGERWGITGLIGAIFIIGTYSPATTFAATFCIRNFQ